MTIARGIWAETAGEAMRDAATWRLVARHGLDVALAVRPGDVALVPEWTALAREHGVRAALWPMVEDQAGRWLSVLNATVFGELVREVRALAPTAEVVLDLEPPFPLVRGLIGRRDHAGRRDAARGLLSLARDTDERREGSNEIVALCREIRGSGAALTLAVPPVALFDGASGAAWARLCGAPDELLATRVNVMLYTSLIEGYSKGVLRRADAVALLARGCAAAVRRFGERASVSLGAVGAGALGDEPVYPEPAALAEDAAVALGAGARDLWLFDLGGVLAKGEPERWLDAFVAPGDAPRAPVPTARSRVASAALWAFGRVMGARAGR